jgi:hypothetical protein
VYAMHVSFASLRAYFSRMIQSARRAARFRSGLIKNSKKSERYLRLQFPRSEALTIGVWDLYCPRRITSAFEEPSIRAVLKCHESLYCVSTSPLKPQQFPELFNSNAFPGSVIRQKHVFVVPFLENRPRRDVSHLF